MKYYTNVVPTTLYSKLLEKGMPVNLVTYAEVFDWLMTKGVCINIYPHKYSYNGDDLWRFICYGKRNFALPNVYNGWIKCADDAIHYTIEQLL